MGSAIDRLERDALKRAVGEILDRHRGPQRAITMVALFRQATGEVVIPNRRYDQTRIVRSVVEQLRREGRPIGLVSGRGGGYFVAQSDTELQPTIDWFHSRAMSSLQQEAALKRITFGELLQQYRLELDPETDRQEQHREATD